MLWVMSVRGMRMDDDLRKIFLASKEYTGLQLGIQKFKLCRHLQDS